GSVGKGRSSWRRFSHQDGVFCSPLDCRFLVSTVEMRLSLKIIEWQSHAEAPVIAEPLLPLELLRPGEWAEVAEVHGEPGWVCRMAELGVRSGCRLQMLRGGCPCLFLLGGTRLSLRGEDAMQV